MRNLNIKSYREPDWKVALMESPVLTSKPDEKGYLSNHLDGIYPAGRDAMMPGGKFYQMFKDGNGSELDPSTVAGKSVPAKACAVYSSSMLAYNFFHWISPEHPFLFSDGTIYDKVYFEVKMPVLKTRPNAPANIDVVMLSKDCHKMICFESKMTEYLNSGDAAFAEAYTKRENYYNNTFSDDFVKYIKDFSNIDHAYNEGISQMVKHLIAITNLQQSNYAMADMLVLNKFIEPDIAKKMQEVPLDIKYSNILFFLLPDSISFGPSATSRYIKLLAHLRDNDIINENLWQYFVLPNYAYTYNDMIAIMRNQMPNGLAAYLEARYPLFPNMPDIFPIKGVV